MDRIKSGVDHLRNAAPLIEILIYILFRHSPTEKQANLSHNVHQYNLVGKHYVIYSIVLLYENVQLLYETSYIIF